MLHLKLIVFAILLVMVKSKSIKNEEELKEKEKEEMTKDEIKQEEEEKKKKEGTQEIPSLPKEPLDCGDEKLMVADKIMCVETNNLIKGVKLPEGLEEEDLLTKPLHPRHRRRRVTAHWLQWPKSADGFVYVPYKFATSHRNVTDAFLLAIGDFNRLSCVRLVPWKSGDRDFINLFSGSGCYTYLGRRGGLQPLSLQVYTACATRGVAVHEILHVLGFYHEMSRRDRDQHITVNYGNIYGSLQRQFRIHPVGNGSVYGENYDGQSVMHYGNYAGAIYSSIPTLTSKQNPSEVLGQRNGMSHKDMQQLNKMYACDGFVTKL